MAEQNKFKEQKGQNRGKGTSPKNQKINPFENLPGTGGKKPKFSFYWIYGLLAILFIGIQIFSTGTEPKKTDWRELKQMLSNGDVIK